MSTINQQSAPQAEEQSPVLLICPLTFSYHVAISETLASQGHEVTWWNDKASMSTGYKLLLRLLPSVTRRWSERHYLRQIEELANTPLRHILVIKGEGLTAGIIRKLRGTFPHASLGLYLWDGVENVKGVERLAPLFDSVSTFDLEDAHRLGWHYRPLFARKVALNADVVADKTFDWCFVGTVHSDRHRVIHRLRSHYGDAMRSFVFAYFQSPVVLLARKLLDRTLWSAPAGTLSTTPMAAGEVAQVIAKSHAVLDVEHPRQRGFTMRTIETLLAGKKLITTNRHLLASNLFHPSRVCLIDRMAPRVPAEFLRQTALPVDDSLRATYTCEGWARELLDLQIAGAEQRRRAEAERTFR